MDGLRGIAALLVVFSHWIGLGPASEYGSAMYLLRRAFWLSPSGVDLFFVLSGFLIGGILLDQKESPNLLRVFWLRRAGRILPLFFLFLGAVMVLCRWPSPPLLTANTQPVWAHALFLTNLWTAWTEMWDTSVLAAAWSLAIEEQIYLVLPFVVLWSPPQRLRAYAIIAFFAAPVLRCLVWMLSKNDLSLAAHTLTFCRMDTFAVGLVIAMEFRQPVPLWNRLSRQILILIVAVPAVVLAWMTRRNEWSGSLVYCAVGYTACALFYGWCLVMALHARWAVRLFSWTPFLWMGRYSFFIYLFQGIIFFAVGRWMAAWNLTFFAEGLRLLLATVALGVAAYLSMRWFEAPIQKWSRSYPYQKTAAIPLHTHAPAIAR